MPDSQSEFIFHQYRGLIDKATPVSPVISKNPIRGQTGCRQSRILLTKRGGRLKVAPSRMLKPKPPVEILISAQFKMNFREIALTVEPRHLGKQTDKAIA